MVPHFIVVKNQMNEHKDADNDTYRCITRNKGDTIVLKAAGMEA